jgi:release factor glutamine methyltransferase
MTLPKRIDDLLRHAATVLAEHGSDSPAVDAAVLLCHVLDKPRSYLLTWPERELTPSQLQCFSSLLMRRVHGEPIAYITQMREFWSLPLKVSPATLIPRPDTECLVALALEKARQISGSLLDLGTGTGAIALALASELPERQVVGVDLKREACDLALENAVRLKINNVRICQGDWFDALKEEGMKFAVIVSNPPYIDTNDPHLKQGDVRFEPASALIAEEDGLADIRAIATRARSYLVTQGWLLFEHGYAQGHAVRHLLNSLGYQQVRTEQDDSGHERVTAGLFSG